MTKIQKLFERAIDKLVKYGWIQGEYGDRATGYCMIGAIDSSTKDIKLIRESRGVLYGILGKQGIGDFNDAPGRKKWEVIAMLKQAIKAAA